jgi:hypothetical protein
MSAEPRPYDGSHRLCVTVAPHSSTLQLSDLNEIAAGLVQHGDAATVSAVMPARNPA